MRGQRRWLWLVVAAGLVVAGGLLVLGWAAWEERSARQALAEDHVDLAQRHIDRAVWVRRWKSSNVLAARIARLRGDHAEAERALGHCGAGADMSDSLQLEWRLLRCQQGEVDELAPGLLALVDRDHAESSAVLEALAACYMRQTRYHEALSCLDRWVERDPDSVRARHWRGWVNNQIDHRAGAIRDYERLLELQPNRADVRQHLAEILVDSSQHDEALPHLERLHAEQPYNPDVVVPLARCWMLQGLTAEARGLLDSVLARYPNHFEALFQRGNLELNAGQFSDAERWLRQAVEQKPSSAEAHYALYRCLQPRPNQQQEAEKQRRRWEQVAATQARLRRLLRTELADNPNNPELAGEAGELFLRIGEDQRGLFWLHRALRLKPGHAATLRALIAYYEGANDQDKVAQYRRQLAGGGSGQ
jgi:tetratricopeptide (TPR) repeat protein